jgi:hypothetical protein
MLDALADTPVVFLAGPRQSGKSTLVRSLGLSLADHGHRAGYLTLDDGQTLAAATRDPDGFIDALATPVIIDEVQRAPDLPRAIKRSVDADRRPGRFLLTGSANALVLPRVSESLAGRMEVLNLLPFSQGELEGREERFVDACFAPRLEITAGSVAWGDLAERISRGGYPEIVGRATAARRRSWFGAYLTTVVDRDVRDIANIEGLHELPRLLRLAAARVSGLLNLADLGKDSGIAKTTLRRYWAMLQAVFLVHLVPAWSANLGLRLVKSPKLQIVDSGLLCYLRGIDAARLVEDDTAAGPVLESFVTMELLKQIGWSDTRPTLHHYRTEAGREVDLVLEDAEGRIVGIEVKRAATVTAADFKGLAHLREQVGSRFVRGIVLHTGGGHTAFDRELFATPIAALWRT